MSALGAWGWPHPANAWSEFFLQVARQVVAPPHLLWCLAARSNAAAETTLSPKRSSARFPTQPRQGAEPSSPLQKSPSKPSPGCRGGRPRQRDRGAFEQQFNLFKKLEKSGKINSSVASKWLSAVIYSAAGTLPCGRWQYPRSAPPWPSPALCWAPPCPPPGALLSWAWSRSDFFPSLIISAVAVRTNGVGLVCASWADEWIHAAARGHWVSASLGRGWGDAGHGRAPCPQEVAWHQGAWFTDFRRDWDGLPWNGFSQISWETLIQEKEPFCVPPIANAGTRYIHLSKLFFHSHAKHGLWKLERKHKH